MHTHHNMNIGIPPSAMALWCDFHAATTCRRQSAPRRRTVVSKAKEALQGQDGCTPARALRAQW